MPKGKPKLDRVDPDTKWRCITLGNNGTIISSTADGFCYLQRGVNARVQNEYCFKIIKSSKFQTFIGIQELTQYDGETEYEYAWRIKLNDGSKFDDDGGMDYYTDQKFKIGDEITMVVDDSRLSFKVNGKDLGVAFDDE